ADVTRSSVSVTTCSSRCGSWWAVCCSSGSPPPPSARGSSCSGVSNSPRGPSSACSGGSICAVSAVSVPRPHVTSKGPIRSPDITVSSFRYEIRPRFFGVFERYVCLRAPELEEPVGGHAASSTETRDPPMSGRNGELRLPGDGRCSIRLSEMSSNATPSTRTGFRSSTRRCRQEGCRSKETVGQLRERSAGDGTGGHEADPDRSHPPVEVLGEGVGVEGEPLESQSSGGVHGVLPQSAADTAADVVGFDVEVGELAFGCLSCQAVEAGQVTVGLRHGRSVRRHVVGAQGQFGPASLQEGFVIAPVGLRTQCEFTQGGGFVWPSG